MSTPKAGTCIATTAKGNSCRSSARTGRSLCAFHDPECREATQSGRTAGGRSRVTPRAVLSAETLHGSLRSVHDVCELLSDTIGDVRTGRLDPKIANTVGYLANVLVRALEVGKIEDRLAAIEVALQVSSQSEQGSSFHRDLAAAGSVDEEE